MTMLNALLGRTEEQEFTCPVCGSHAFGTEANQNLGVCHGYTQTSRQGQHGSGAPRRCRFTWSRDDDAKYFKGTGYFHDTVQTGMTLARIPLPVDTRLGEPSHEDMLEGQRIFGELGDVPKRRGGPFWTDIIMVLREHGFRITKA